MTSRSWRIGLVGVMGLLAIGCAKKLTYENWQTIYDGQSADSVECTLGEPRERGESRWTYMGHDCRTTADIYFSDSQVIGKTWSDPKHGMQGQSPLVNQPGEAETHTYRKAK